MSITLHGIAEKTGVNISTVSRALNNKPSVKEETKQRILKAAQTMGYRPNGVARSLVTKKTETLGLVMPSIKCLGHTLFSSMLEGIAQEVQELGYSLLFSVVDVETHGSEQAIAKLEEQRVDGFILGWFKEQYIDESQLLQLVGQEVPFVVIGDRYLTSKKINMVACDNFLGAYKATKHLIDLGHKKIATISGPAERSIVKNRFAGFKAALEQAGIPYLKEYHRCWHRSSDFRKAGGGEAAMHSLLDEGGDFTAVFAFSDMFAAEAIRAIVQRGFKVPDDFAVVGFDDAEYCRLLNPSLTTVKQPYRKIGKEAVRMLKQLIDGEKLLDNHRWIEPELIVRESCSLRSPTPSRFSGQVRLTVEQGRSLEEWKERGERKESVRKPSRELGEG